MITPPVTPVPVGNATATPPSLWLRTGAEVLVLPAGSEAVTKTGVGLPPDAANDASGIVIVVGLLLDVGVLIVAPAGNVPLIGVQTPVDVSLTNSTVVGIVEPTGV